MKLYSIATLLFLFFSFQVGTCQPAKNADSFSWDNATVYFLFTDRFCNGNTANDLNYGRKTEYGNDTINAATFHGGDLAGVIQKLKEGYFTKLGITAIWITGVYEQIHGWVGGGEKNDFPHYSYHGYYPQDLTSIDKNFGTINEFREFVNLAHAQGIRVIMDAGLNHPGYSTLLDCVQYGFGGQNMSQEEAVKHVTGWEYTKKFEPSGSVEWNSWWGKEWARTAEEDTLGVLTESIFGLPDFRTESQKPVAIPAFLKKKWEMERESDKVWSLPVAGELRKDMNIAPADYLIKWLAAWVREFGLDGFRCDVVENVDLFRWKQLNDECNDALREWRKNNPNDNASQWNDSFWMTGDIWDSGIQYYPQFASAGFNSIVNFTFPKTGNLNEIGAIWQEYADSLNFRTNWNTLSFLNNTYKRDTDVKNMINCGTALLLSPGAIQIFYGDEVARKQSAGRFLSDPVQGYRSDYDWKNQDLNVLKHWQMLGSFRKRHIAVGAGKQTTVANNVFVRTYDQNGVSDKVMIVISDKGKETINTGNYFSENTKVINACTGETATVMNGQVQFATVNHLILLEEAL